MKCKFYWVLSGPVVCICSKHCISRDTALHSIFHLHQNWINVFILDIKLGYHISTIGIAVAERKSQF